MTGKPARLSGEFVRDEEGQAAYLRELLEIFDSAGLDSAFVFLFALHDHPHRPDGDPRLDLDLASYGIVKVYEDRLGDTYPDMAWEPKAAFHALAAHYGEISTRRASSTTRTAESAGSPPASPPTAPAAPAP